MDKPKHSPLPWSTGTDEDAHVIYDANLDAIADTLRDDGDGPLEAGNASLSVRAVNAHAGLLAAAKKAASQFVCVGTDENRDTCGVTFTCGPRLAAAELRAAIAQATGS